MAKVGMCCFTGDSFFSESIYDKNELKGFVDEERKKVRKDRFYIPRVYELVKYSRMFDIVEVDHFFYNKEHDDFYDLSETCARWKVSVPEGFCFNIKMPSVITNDKKLSGVGHELKMFFEGLYEQKDKISHIILLFRRDFSKDGYFDVFCDFIRHLPKDYSYVVEFSNASWYCKEVMDVLKEKGIKLLKIVDVNNYIKKLKYLDDYDYFRFFASGRNTNVDLDVFYDDIKGHVAKDAHVMLDLPVMDALHVKRLFDGQKEPKG